MFEGQGLKTQDTSVNPEAATERVASAATGVKKTESG
jgi:hypothetical protein